MATLENLIQNNMVYQNNGYLDDVVAGEMISDDQAIYLGVWLIKWINAAVWSVKPSGLRGTG